MVQIGAARTAAHYWPLSFLCESAAVSPLEERARVRARENERTSERARKRERAKERARKRESERASEKERESKRAGEREQKTEWGRKRERERERESKESRQQVDAHAPPPVPPPCVRMYESMHECMPSRLSAPQPISVCMQGSQHLSL